MKRPKLKEEQEFAEKCAIVAMGALVSKHSKLGGDTKDTDWGLGKLAENSFVVAKAMCKERERFHGLLLNNADSKDRDELYAWINKT